MTLTAEEREYLVRMLRKELNLYADARWTLGPGWRPAGGEVEMMRKLKRKLERNDDDT